MSLGSSVSGLSFSGVGSGIDSDAIVRQLMQLERRPLQRIQARKVGIESQRDVYSQFRSRFQTLNGAAAALSSPTAFRSVRATSSDPSVATVSATAGSNPGTFNLSVTLLAQAQKLGSTAQASATAALGHSGSFIVNGRAVTVGAGDSLTAIAAKVNAAQAGVVASVIDAGPGNAFLTLTATGTGAQSAIQIARVSGDALAGLGFVDGAASVREPVAGGARSYGFANPTETLGRLTGASMSGVFRVNGVDVAVDFAADTLQSLAAKVIATGTGATATVVTATQNGQTVHKLEIAGTGMPSGLADPNGILEAIGVLQRGYQSVLVAAQDAQFSLDGVAMSRATNTVADVVAGATITLLRADSGSPPSTTLTLTQDTEAVKGTVKSFLSAVNGLLDFVRTNSTFDRETFRSGPLFSDPVAALAVSTIGAQLFADVPGGPFVNLTQVGFGLDESGNLRLDDSALDRALAQDSEGVRRLFAAVGSTTTSDLRYVSSTGKTVSAGTGAYSVEITRAATKARMTGNLAQVGPSILGETLTFGGAAFGNRDVVLFVPSGSTATSLVALINGDARLRDVVEASLAGDGRLQLTSRRFGALGDFTAKSDQAATVLNSGLGESGGVFVGGLDVAGRINGEAATGVGQFLTGDRGNATTEGLQIQYTGSSTGFVGEVRFSRGIASQLASRADQFLEAQSGFLTSADATLESQVRDLDRQITDFEALLKVREERIRARFLAMERAISQLQAQQAQFARAASVFDPARR